MADHNPIDAAIDEISYIAKMTYGLQSIMEENSDTNAFNYHAKEYYRRLTNSYQAAARRALVALKELKDANLDDIAPVAGLTPDRVLNQPIPAFVNEPVQRVSRKEAPRTAKHTTLKS